MIKKASLFVICAIVLLGLCGCGYRFENEIVGKTFVHSVESDETDYGKIITSQTFIFNRNGEGIDKIDIDFTGEFKEYAETHISYDTRHTTDYFNYTIDAANSSVSFTTNDGAYSYDLRYDKESKCLIDKENEKIKYCRQ